MNKVYIIGNLTRDPEMRSTRDGIPVCSFTVAVNRRNRSAQAGQPEADYFRVTAWRGLAEICSRYLEKGKKAAVTGAVSVSTYTTNAGEHRAQMEITADDVEFLSPRDAGMDVQEMQYQQAERAAIKAEEDLKAIGAVIVDDDELPF